MESMVGALAIFTIGAALLIGCWLFLRHNRDPKNYDATKRVAQDGGSAATSAVPWETVDGRSLRQRLDDAPSVDDRLSTRRVGAKSEVLDMRWSVLRATMKGERAT